MCSLTPKLPAYQTTIAPNPTLHSDATAMPNKRKTSTNPPPTLPIYVKVSHQHTRVSTSKRLVCTTTSLLFFSPKRHVLRLETRPTPAVQKNHTRVNHLSRLTKHFATLLDQRELSTSTATVQYLLNAASWKQNKQPLASAPDFLSLMNTKLLQD